MTRRTWLLLLCSLAVGCRTTPARSPTASAPPPAPTPRAEATDLPAPRQSGPLSLEETLAKRRSLRAYREEPLSMAELSQLLWACQGETHAAGLRTAPSAGALYPLEVYLATADGVHRYSPRGHRLEQTRRDDVRKALADAAVGQDSVAMAPAVFVIAAVYARTAQKYGERAPLYVHLEAGHAAQNLLLQAVALGLGGVPIGAFYEDRLARALALPSGHEPLYIIAIGRPAA